MKENSQYNLVININLISSVFLFLLWFALKLYLYWFGCLYLILISFICFCLFESMNKSFLTGKMRMKVPFLAQSNDVAMFSVSCGFTLCQPVFSYWIDVFNPCISPTRWSAVLSFYQWQKWNRDINQYSQQYEGCRYKYELQ